MWSSTPSTKNEQPPKNRLPIPIPKPKLNPPIRSKHKNLKNNRAKYQLQPQSPTQPPNPFRAHYNPLKQPQNTQQNLKETKQIRFSKVQSIPEIINSGTF